MPICAWPLRLWFWVGDIFFFLTPLSCTQFPGCRRLLRDGEAGLRQDRSRHRAFGVDNCQRHHDPFKERYDSGTENATEFFEHSSAVRGQLRFCNPKPQNVLRRVRKDVKYVTFDGMMKIGATATTITAAGNIVSMD